MVVQRFFAIGWHRLTASMLLLLLFGSVGCDRSGGLSHFEQVKQSQQQAADALKGKGGTAEEKRYPQGDAWVVDLKGLTIDEEVIAAVQALGEVSELNLSGSTIADDQIAVLAVREPLGTLIKLDISDTQVSDAGLLELADLHLLFDINVKNSKVTPAGLKQYRSQRPKHPFGLALKVTK